jgi:hypothetical protein
MPGNRFPVFRSEKRKGSQWSPKSIHSSIIVFGHYHFALAKIPEPDFWPAQTLDWPIPRSPTFGQPATAPSPPTTTTNNQQPTTNN